MIVRSSMLYDALMRFIDHFVFAGWKPPVRFALDFVVAWRLAAAFVGNCIPSGTDKDRRSSSLSKLWNKTNAGLTSSVKTFVDGKSPAQGASAMFFAEHKLARCANSSCLNSPKPANISSDVRRARCRHTAP
ncbi:hypothetical protein BDV98DRAFT_175651 [Pterulicium gracile]|uniref:Uncharacterized protein n=1 Tax=Pterulicium gracile TaxID=1884261 RepID=A0A5C3QDV1_9AGAR|nr:hypothetical protein BDV98DRAFT_175651 [Pterula gracilis]